MERLSDWDIQAPTHNALGSAARPVRDPTRSAIEIVQERSLPKGGKCRNRARGSALAAGWLLFAPLAGHAQGLLNPEAVVIRVGPLEATLGQISSQFHTEAKADTSTLTPDRAGVRRFRDRFVGTLLGHAWTLQDSSSLNPTDRFMITLGVDKVLQDALRDELLPRYLRSDEKTLRAVYDRMGTQLRLAVIKVMTYVELDSLQAALARGVPFEQAARTWSRDMTTSRSGGELGWADATRFDLATQETLWALREGEISPPIPEANFHSLYKVLERRPSRVLAPFETLRPGILTSVQRHELGNAGQKMHEDLMAAYHFRVDPDGAEWLRGFLKRETAQARRTYDPSKDKSVARFGEPTEEAFWQEAPLQGEEARRIVARTDGDSLTALEVIDELVFMPTLVWPTFDSVTDVYDLCDSALYYRVRLREAVRLGLDKHPAVRRSVLDRQRWVHWRAHLREKVHPEIEPTEEELKAAYRRKASLYDLPEMRRFVLVNTATRDLAMQAARRLGEGRSPSDIVVELQAPDLEFQINPDTTSGWTPRGRYPSIDDRLFSLREGEVSDPIPDRGRYTVVRLEGILPARTLSFEEARPSLRREIMEPRERRKIAEIQERARGAFRVWVDASALEAMPIDPEPFQARRNRGGR